MLKNKIVTNTFKSVVFHLFFQIINRLTGEGQEHFEVHTLGTKTIFEIANHVLNFAVYHSFRNFYFSVIANFVDYSRFFNTLSFLLFTSCQFLLQIFFIFFQGVEFANVLRKFIIKCRKLFTFDFMNFYFEYSFFTSQIFSMVSFRECYSYVFEVASSKTYYLLFKTRDESTASKFQRVTLCLAAFKSYAVNRTVKVDNYSVAVLSCFVINNNELCMTLLKTLKLLAQFLFSNFNAGSRYFDSFVFAKSNLRLNRYFSFEFESLSFFELLYVNFRTIHREDLSLINSL
ncbi:hypothetical protein D3C81_1037050 [compost metagenome]